MASEHSITIQVAPFSLKPFSPGHVAVVINTPTEQTYAGFGPNRVDRIPGGMYSKLGQFDVQRVPRDVSPRVGTADEENYSTAFKHNEHSTFTIPVSEAQAKAALAEINKLGVSHGSYNGLTLNVCSAIVNQILAAARLPKLATDPSTDWLTLENYNERFLKDPNDALAPWIDLRWRDLQKDYAYTGRGYDTPSEFRGGIWSRGRTEVDHVPLGLPGQIGDGDGVGDWWRNIGEDPKKMSLTANESFAPLNAAIGKADNTQHVNTEAQLFQGPNGRPVAATTEWQNEVNASPFASAQEAVPFMPYQSMPYSAARLAGQTFEDPPARVLRLMPQQQSDFDSSSVMGAPADQDAAASAAPVPSDEMSELLKLRSIIQAVGNRGLFPIQ